VFILLYSSYSVLSLSILHLFQAILAIEYKKEPEEEEKPSSPPAAPEPEPEQVPEPEPEPVKEEAPEAEPDLLVTSFATTPKQS
jgi:outer membrane biosynthesis protein TonB